MSIIKLGFRLISNDKIPISLVLERYPHWLICGPSGSGKSYLTKYLFWSLVKIHDLEIYCCDFKNSGDYSFIDSEHLAVGTDCPRMIKAFYDKYHQIKEENLPQKILMVFDEWAAYCLWAEAYDKKLAKESKDQVAEILMMGRKLGSNNGGAFLWTVLQRPDATYFGSSRDNYFVKIIMKDVTKSIRTMLDVEDEDIPEEHIAKTGHGVCFLDDAIYAFVVPHYDSKAMDALLTAKRQRSRKQS